MPRRAIHRAAQRAMRRPGDRRCCSTRAPRVGTPGRSPLVCASLSRSSRSGRERASHRASSRSPSGGVRRTTSCRRSLSGLALLMAGRPLWSATVPSKMVASPPSFGTVTLLRTAWRPHGGAPVLRCRASYRWSLSGLALLMAGRPLWKKTAVRSRWRSAAFPRRATETASAK